jgi:hypothetical protein
MSLANLSINKVFSDNFYQVVHYSGVKLFNMLPREIKSIAGNPNKFKEA